MVLYWGNLTHDTSITSRILLIDQVITVWLEASIKAHDFVDGEFWESKVTDMRDIYIPSAENYVYEKEGIIKEFISLYTSTLAAIFVSPDS